jgi:imidazolonepropionase-like amidohydrolase
MMICRPWPAIGQPAARRTRRSRRNGRRRSQGFAWTPHGTYAKELTFFVKHVGFSPLETIRCATKTGAEIMGRGDEFGILEAGKLADVLVVEGDVAADVAILEDRARLLAVMQGGVVKAGRLLQPAP